MSSKLAERFEREARAYKQADSDNETRTVSDSDFFSQTGIKVQKRGEQ